MSYNHKLFDTVVSRISLPKEILYYIKFFFNVFNTLYKTKHFRQRGSTADALMLTKQTFIGVSF